MTVDKKRVLAKFNRTARKTMPMMMGKQYMSVVFHDIAVAKRIFELMSTQDERDGGGGC